VEHRYVQHERGQVVQSSWALLTLLAARRAGCTAVHAAAIERGIAFVVARQNDDGGWDREQLAGVFNRNCAINYDNYRFIFPLWALGRYVAAC
jgi:lanosterol synthase